MPDGLTMTSNNSSNLSQPGTVTWFHRFLKWDASSRIRVDQLFELHKRTTKNEITKTAFMRFLKKAYPGISKIRARTQGERYWVLEGLAYQSTNSDKENVLKISEIVKLSCIINLGYFTIKQDSQTCKLGYIHTIKVNDLNVMSEVTITDGPTVCLDFFVFGKHLNSADLGLIDVQLSTNSLSAVFQLIPDISFCVGYKQYYGTESKCNNIIKEKWDSPEFSEYVYRSQRCRRVLMDKHGKVCKVCRTQNHNFIIRNRQRAAKLLSPVDSDPGVNSIPVTTAESDLVQDSTQLEHPVRNAGILIGQLFPWLEKDSDLEILIDSQVNNGSQSDKRHYRWDPRIIRLCLMLWGRSPKAYDDLRSSGFLILPTARLLRYYKNAIHQQPGIQHDLFLWMRKESDRLGLTPEMREGGLILDEMSIQEDVFIQNDGKLCGLTNLGEASDAIRILRTGKDTASIASHVLQLIFLGDTGFRFPISHYPCREATAVELFSIVWENIGCLTDYGFRVNYISMDGASTNRSFMKMHFKDPSPEYLRDQNFEVKNAMPPNETVIFLMDPSHCFKKIRNNLLKSGDGNQYKKKLQIGGRCLHWNVWIKAYNWDRATNSVRVHHRLTQEHLFPDNAQKMRNHLAEEVLNTDMLYLMQSYQRSLDADDSGKVNVVIEFLTQTSTFINILRDLRPVFVSNDDRLEQLQSVHSWFIDWEYEVMAEITKNPKQRAALKKKLMSDQTREDISSGILGFIQLCKNKTNRACPGSIIPARVNTDVVENVFCQQRGLHHGNTTNPNYNSYCYGINSILLGQSSISRKRKSNSGLVSADPVPCQLDRPLNIRKKTVLPRI